MMDLRHPNEFSRDFLAHYLSRGMGSLSKRDIDILVLYLLIEQGVYEFPGDFFKASKQLKISEPKLRNLFQEVQLRYKQYDEEEAKRMFIDIVRTEFFEKSGSRITFVVHDPLLRQYFEEWVSRAHGFTDTSFNKNLFSISPKVLQRVLEHLCHHSYEDLVDLMANLPMVKDSIQGEKTLTGFLGNFVNEFFKAAGREAGTLSVSTLVEVLKYILL